MQKRKAKREIRGKHYIGLSECTKNVVGTTKAVHEFCGALKRGAKATGREVTRHGHRAVDRGRPTSGGPVRSTGRTAFFPSHSVPMGPPFLTGRTSKFLPESNGPARLTMAVLGRPPGARVRRPRRASEGAARCTWWATISAETAGERKTLENAGNALSAEKEQSRTAELLSGGHDGRQGKDIPSDLVVQNERLQTIF